MNDQCPMTKDQWRTVVLGEISKPKQWPTLSRVEMSDAGYPVYGANGRIGFHGSYTHERPTILVGCRGSCGTVHITEPKAYANGNAMALDDLNEDLVNLGFLSQFLRPRGFADVVSGTSQPQIIRQNIVRIEIPLPPLAEQRRIAEVLDRAEALRAKRRAALAHLDTLTQSLFLDLFGDPATNPKRWPMVSLESVLSLPLRNGLSPSKSGKVLANVLTLSAITGNGFEATAWKTSTFTARPPENQSVSEADFLICRGNGNVHMVGKGYFPSKAMPEMTFPDTMIAARISPARIERALLQHVWNSTAVRKQIESVARTTNGTFKVNQPSLEKIRFVSPPLPLQREFARRVSAVEKLKAAQRAALAELDALFASLQHRAFRGEL